MIRREMMEHHGDWIDGGICFPPKKEEFICFEYASGVVTIAEWRRDAYIDIRCGESITPDFWMPITSPLDIWWRGKYYDEMVAEENLFPDEIESPELANSFAAECLIARLEAKYKMTWDNLMGSGKIDDDDMAEIEALLAKDKSERRIIPDGLEEECSKYGPSDVMSDEDLEELNDWAESSHLEQS